MFGSRLAGVFVGNRNDRGCTTREGRCSMPLDKEIVFAGWLVRRSKEASKQLDVTSKSCVAGFFSVLYSLAASQSSKSEGIDARL